MIFRFPRRCRAPKDFLPTPHPMGRIASYKDYSEIMPAINHVLELKIPTIVISSTKTLNNFKDARCVLTFPGTDTAMDNYFIDILFNLMCMIYRTNYIDGN